jgi:hypothetical protein
MNEYNRKHSKNTNFDNILDSVGTEIPYSATSTPGYSAATNFSNYSKSKKTNDKKTMQKGGFVNELVNYFFPSNNVTTEQGQLLDALKKDNFQEADKLMNEQKVCVNTTELNKLLANLNPQEKMNIVMNAIASGTQYGYNVADSLMERDFTPVFTKETVQNSLNLLLDAVDKTKNASKVLLQTVEDNVRNQPEKLGRLTSSLMENLDVEGKTKFLMSALESKTNEGREVADSVMSYLSESTFVPDFDVINKKGENLLHVLVDSVKENKNAEIFMENLLTVPNLVSKEKRNEAFDKIKKGLDKVNNEDLSPFIAAAKEGYQDVANLMAQYGPARYFPQGYLEVMTEREPAVSGPVVSESNPSGRNIPVNIVASASASASEPTSPNKPSIFSKAKETVGEYAPAMNRSIEDIVKAFGTSKPTETELARTPEAATERFFSSTSPISSHPYYQQFQKRTGELARGVQSRAQEVAKGTQKKAEQFREQLRSAEPGLPTIMENLQSRVPSVPSVNPEQMRARVQETGQKLYEGMQPQMYEGMQPQMQEAKENVSNPTGEVDEELFAQLVDKMNERTKGQTNMMGGATKKNKNNKMKTSANSHRVVGTRNMLSFSELSDSNMMFGGLSDHDKISDHDEMRKISRAVKSKTDQFHEEAVEKIRKHLKDNDLMTAKAIKAIIYKEIKEKKPQLSGLDRAAELLKAIDDNKIKEVLQQTDLINSIISHLLEKKKEHEGKSKTNKSENGESIDTDSEVVTKAKTKAKATATATKSKKDKTTQKGKMKPEKYADFESSVSLTSDYDSSSDDDFDETSDSVTTTTEKSKNNKSKRRTRYFDL